MSKTRAHGPNQNERQPTGPLVGIWWRIGPTIIAFTEPARPFNALCPVHDFEGSHIDFWHQVIQQHPKLLGKGYESVPRGRVLRQWGVFHLLMPHRYTKDPNFCHQLIQRFHLQDCRVQIMGDQHYDPPETADFEDD